MPLCAAVGNRSLSALRRALTPDGTLVIVGGRKGRLLGPLALPLKALVVARFVGQRLLVLLALNSKEDLILKELIEDGKVTPVVDRTYSLSEAPEAIRYIETGHARAKTVITV